MRGINVPVRQLLLELALATYELGQVGEVPKEVLLPILPKRRVLRDIDGRLVAMGVTFYHDWREISCGGDTTQIPVRPVLRFSKETEQHSFIKGAVRWVRAMEGLTRASLVGVRRRAERPAKSDPYSQDFDVGLHSQSVYDFMRAHDAVTLVTPERMLWGNRAQSVVCSVGWPLVVIAGDQVFLPSKYVRGFRGAGAWLFKFLPALDENWELMSFRIISRYDFDREVVLAAFISGRDLPSWTCRKEQLRDGYFCYSLIS